MRRTLLLGACGALALGTRASAQELQWTVSGTAGGMFPTSAMSLAGDVDGDGFDDVILGDPDDFAGGFLNGDAQVYSGVDGALIYEYSGDTLDGLGRIVDGAGDVNQDGHDDFWIGSHEEHPVLYSGIDGSPLFELSSLGPSVLPDSIAGAGDVNGDGFPDVIVGDASAALSTGRAWVFSGAFMAVGTPPEILYEFSGPAGGSGGGLTVEGAGDVNGDGRADLVVGWPNESGSVGMQSYCGIVRVFSGVDGSLIRALHGFGPCGGFGSCLAALGDLDGDGLDELLVGAPSDDTNGSNAGLARVYSGSDGAVLHTYLGDEASDSLGGSVSAAGDVNGDGVLDFLIGTAGDDTATGSGTVGLYSGSDGGLLSVFGLHGGAFGSFVAGGARFDGDAYADFAVVATHTGGGELYGFGGLCTGENHRYCTAAPNTASATGGRISAAGSTSLGANDLVLSATDCPPGQNGVFFYGLQQQQIPFGDGTLCVGPPFYRIQPLVPIDGLGHASLALDLDAPPIGSGPGMIEPGDTRYFSFWFRDPLGGPVGFNYTNGRVITFCP